MGQSNNGEKKKKKRENYITYTKGYKIAIHKTHAPLAFIVQCENI